MNSNFKDIFILGVVFLFILLFLFIFQIQKDGNDLAIAKENVTALAYAKALDTIHSGDLFLFGGSHGWGIDELPAVDITTYETCLSKIIPIRLYREYTDVVRNNPKEDYDRLINEPEKTFTYAEKFNSILIHHINRRGLKKCDGHDVNKSEIEYD